MGVHTGVFVIYYLYRSRYSFVAGHLLKDGHHVVDLSHLGHALKFTSECMAQEFIRVDLDRPADGPYFVSELTLGELLEHCPELYEIRRPTIHGGAA